MAYSAELGRALRLCRVFEPVKSSDDQGMCAVLGRVRGDTESWARVMHAALSLEQDGVGGVSLSVGKTYFLHNNRVRWGWSISVYGQDQQIATFISALYGTLQSMFPCEKIMSMPLSCGHVEGSSDGKSKGAYNTRASGEFGR